MTELQFYHWIATGALGVLVTILGWLGKNMADDMKAKLSKEEFSSYLADAKQSRSDLRESIIKLFEKMENHDKLDASRFDGIIKDFNGGVSRLSEKISDVQVNILTQLNGKADK
jgi:hypothetical protein